MSLVRRNRNCFYVVVRAGSWQSCFARTMQTDNQPQTYSLAVCRLIAQFVIVSLGIHLSERLSAITAASPCRPF